MVGTSSVNTRETVGIECVATENSKSREGDVKNKRHPFWSMLILFKNKRKGVMTAGRK